MPNSERAELSFSGDLVISNIESLRAELGAVLQQASAVEVDLSDVAEVDLTFIQLVEAARRKAADIGCGLSLRQPAEGAVLEVLQRGGFLDDRFSDRAKFWLQEATQ